jgi:ABC-type branched-subunit amino acid transport system ATPase component
MAVSSAIFLDRTADRAPALMQVAGLCKRYGEQRALADISFAVNAGEVVGLIGPNGAGKTTLMAARVCDRFVLLAEGRIRGVGTLAELRAQIGKPAAGLEEVFLALT